MKKNGAYVLAICNLALLGCAGAAGGGANDAGDLEPAGDDESLASQGVQPVDSDEASAGTDGSTGSAAEPQFSPGMSVVEATNAVPDTIERLNIEQEALAEPLLQPDLYEPCSLQGHHHFKVKVAVWDGRAVGVDVTTEPSDEKLESCLRQQLSNVEWKDKAKSINTVEYNY